MRRQTPCGFAGEQECAQNVGVEHGPQPFNRHIRQFRRRRHDARIHHHGIQPAKGTDRLVIGAQHIGLIRGIALNGDSLASRRADIGNRLFRRRLIPAIGKRHAPPLPRHHQTRRTPDAT